MSRLATSTERFTMKAGPGPEVSRGFSTWRKFFRVIAALMKEAPCFSTSWLLDASGSMTVISLGSHLMWRRISGRVPLPIEPKPIITMGPFQAACMGQFVISSELLCLKSRSVDISFGQLLAQKNMSRVQR